MNLIIVNILLLFILFGCSDREDRGIHQVIDSASSQIERKYNANCTAVGLGALTGVGSLTLYFKLKENPDIFHARQLIVESVGIFLADINANKNLRPYLKEYPFPPTRISMAFNFHDGSYDPVRIPGEIKSVSIYNGIIEYRTVKKKGIVRVGDKDVILLQETFEEARRAVESEKNI